MTAAPSRAEALSGQRPECQPWLALLRHVFSPTVEREFARTVTGVPPRRDREAVPLLTGVTLFVDPDLLGRYLTRLLSTAAEASGAAPPAGVGEADRLSLLEAAIAQDGDPIARVA